MANFSQKLALIFIFIGALSQRSFASGFVDQPCAILITQANLTSLENGSIAGYFPKAVLSYHDSLNFSGIVLDEDNVSNSWIPTTLDENKKHVIHKPTLIGELRHKVADLDPEHKLADTNQGETALENGITKVIFYYLGENAKDSGLDMTIPSIRVDIGTRDAIKSLHDSLVKNPKAINNIHFDKAEMEVKIFEQRPTQGSSTPVVGNLRGAYLVTHKTSDIGGIIIPSFGGVRTDDGALTYRSPLVFDFKGADLRFKTSAQGFFSEILRPATGNTIQFQCLDGKDAKAQSCIGDEEKELSVAFWQGVKAPNRAASFYVKSLTNAMNIYRVQLEILDTKLTDNTLLARAKGRQGNQSQGSPSSSSNPAAFSELSSTILSITNNNRVLDPNTPVEKLPLGVSFSREATQSGALITVVYPGTPAANAGLKAGDTIIFINKNPVSSYVSSYQDVLNVIPKYSGQEVEIAYIDGQSGFIIKRVKVSLRKPEL